MLLGIIILCLGVLFFAQAISTTFTVEFGLVWPIVLLAITFYNVCKTKKFDWISFVLAFASIWFILVYTNVIPTEHNKIFWPVLAIIVGISIIYNTIKFKKRCVSKSKKDEIQDYFGIFGGVEEEVDNSDFKGANVYSVFGGADLDLTKIKIKEEAVTINVYSVFGGSEIRLPKNYRVVFNSSAIFGANENGYKADAKENGKTIYINCISIFGGSEIK